MSKRIHRGGRKKGSIGVPLRDQALVIGLHLIGKTVSEIHRATRLNRATVTKIVAQETVRQLSQEESTSQVRQVRDILLDALPAMALRYREIALDGEDQHAATVIGKTMEGMQAFIPKTQQELTHKSKFEGRSDAELDWHIRFGTRDKEFPDADDQAYFSANGRWPQEERRPQA
jgi:hypothetical protein